MITTAITRTPSVELSNGLTTANLGPPEYDKALKQHGQYVELLIRLGLKVEVLAPVAEFPDAHFVEDTAVVFPELALIMRPGAPSRRGEAGLMVPVLANYRKVVRIDPPGILDGGDVLTIGKNIFVGLTDRTNRAGFDQLSEILKPLNYNCQAIPVTAGLHLKSSVNYIGNDTILVTQELAGNRVWEGYRKIIVDPEETYAANTLWVNDNLLVPAGFPGTTAMIKTLGLPVHELEMTEMQKMDGGLTCLSLRFQVD